MRASVARGGRAQRAFAAITSTSTATFLGSAATPMVERAGYAALN
jgi:hypothetical protein